MRALFLALASISALMGCSSPTKDAEREYEIVKSGPGAKASEVCAAGRAVADAYLKAKDASKYRDAKLRADIECQAAELDAAAPMAQADNLEAAVP
jgi:hypothetical protein